MAIELSKNYLSDHTERYRAAGLNEEFLNEMAKAFAAMQASCYEPYDQLYGYLLHNNNHYITRHGGARGIVSNMDPKDIKTFLKHYKKHK